MDKDTPPPPGCAPPTLSALDPGRVEGRDSCSTVSSELPKRKAPERACLGLEFPRLGDTVLPLYQLALQGACASELSPSSAQSSPFPSLPP